MTKLFSYVVDHDLGFAPNPFGGFCTLAKCKFGSTKRNIVEMAARRQDLNSNQKRFDLRRTPEEAFLIGRRARRNSAITDEFSAREACAEERMTFWSQAALIGRFSRLLKKRLNKRDSRCRFTES